MNVVPVALPRRLIHGWRTSCEAIEREHGLIDIDIDIDVSRTDTRPKLLERLTGSRPATGSPTYQPRERLAVHRQRTILEAGAFSERRPHTKGCRGPGRAGEIARLYLPALRKESLP